MYDEEKGFAKENETTQKSDKKITEDEMKRLLSLIKLKKVTERNLNLAKKAKRNLTMTAIASVLSILVGIIFIVLQNMNKFSFGSKIVANSLYGIFSGGVLLSSLKSIFESSKASSTMKPEIIGPSEIELEIVNLSLGVDKKDGSIGTNLDTVSKIIKERNDDLRDMRNLNAASAIFGSIVLIVLVCLNIFIGLVSLRKDYIYFVNVVLILGGVNGLVHCLNMHYILTKPEMFNNFITFFLFSFVDLLLSGLIRTRGRLGDDENVILENNLLLPITLSHRDFFLVRVTLENSEKEKIDLLLHGLNYNDKLHNCQNYKLYRNYI